MTYFSLLVAVFYLLAAVNVPFVRSIDKPRTAVVLALAPVVAILWLLYALRLPGWLW